MVNLWENISNNALTTYFNDSGDNSVLDAEGNACIIIALTII